MSSQGSTRDTRLYLINISPDADSTGGRLYDRRLKLELCAKFPGTVRELIFGTRKKYLLMKILIMSRIFIKIIATILVGARDDLYFINSGQAMYFLPAAFILKLTGRKIITVTHLPVARDLGKRRGVYGRLAKYCERQMLRLSDFPVAPSRFTSNSVSILADRNPSEVIYIPIPLRKHLDTSDLIIRNTSVTSTSSAIPSEINLLFVGNIIHRKGVHLIVEALKRLRDRYTYLTEMKLLLAGNAPDKQYIADLKNAVSGTGIKLVYKGWLDHEELEELYLSSDIFLFPSTDENFGIALAEAMGYGLPCVAFLDSGSDDFLKPDINAIAVERGNIEAFAEAIKDLIDNPKLRASLSAGGVDTYATLPDERAFLEGVNTLLAQLNSR